VFSPTRPRSSWARSRPKRRALHQRRPMPLRWMGAARLLGCIGAIALETSRSLHATRCRAARCRAAQGAPAAAVPLYSGPRARLRYCVTCRSEKWRRISPRQGRCRSGVFNSANVGKGDRATARHDAASGSQRPDSATYDTRPRVGSRWLDRSAAVHRIRSSGGSAPAESAM
jgi:hypothetical protein